MTDLHDIKDRTFAFATRIVRLCQTLDENPGVSRTLANQLLRSGTSVGANVEEAHGSHSKPDFTAKMSIANKEARETKYWLRLLSATEIVPSEKIRELTDESHQLIAILTTIVKRSQHLVEAHERFSRLVDRKKFQVVYPVLPMDVLGTYILVPQR